MEKSRLVTVSFQGQIPANSNRTYRSNAINLPFRTKRIRAAFPAGTNRLLRLSYFISPDDSTPTTEPPTGTNVLSQLGGQPYVVGDDNLVDFQHEIRIEVAGKYLKVYCENSDVAAHTLDTQITVEIIPWEDEEVTPKKEK